MLINHFVIFISPFQFSCSASLPFCNIYTPILFLSLFLNIPPICILCLLDFHSHSVILPFLIPSYTVSGGMSVRDSYPAATGLTLSKDVDDNKYRRKNPLEMVSRWIK